MEHMLLGRRLGHSFSPEIHKALGCPGYGLRELEPEELPEFFKKREFSGLNVTIPYKLAVMPLVDEVSPEAREIGSVNTVVNRGGRLYAYNTDIDGFTAMLRSAGIELRGKKAVVLGSGGTSLTARAAAKKLDAAEIVVVSRSGEDNYENLSRHRDADVVINTTPVGMYPSCPAAPVDLTLFDRLSGVADVVYNPRRTGLLLQAERLNIPCTGGLRMLVWQAKRAEELFFDRSIPEARAETVLNELCRSTQNIVLIGMPGSGKSTIGRILSRISGREAVDTDAMVVEKAGMTIPEIFEKYGEEHFRRLETEAVAESGKRSGIIITCGGGVVTQERNYPLLHQNGVIFELRRDLEKLSTRARPLSRDLGALRDMYEKRKPMYEAFRDVPVDNNGVFGAAAEYIWRYYSENTRY